MTWISVSERLPRPDQRVDVWRRGKRETDCVCYSSDTKDGTLVGCWNDRFGGYIGRASVTHWMEIPPGPGLQSS
jgi:hypothetical protein